MNKQERIEMVRAMETIARTINDENILEQWLIYGVADGDIDENTKNEDLDYYTNDETFQDLMNLFLILMSSAKKSGGLYCDNIVSK